MVEIPRRDGRHSQMFEMHWKSEGGGFICRPDHGGPNICLMARDGKVHIMDFPTKALDSDSVRWLSLRLQEGAVLSDLQRAGFIE